MLKEKDNKVIFKVSRNANKIEIKKAVEEIFKVSVDSVTTINCKGKKKRMGRYEGKRSDWKKAMVTLKEGEKLDFIEGV
jgi:large subunit ribosomal protein L23